MRGLRAGGLKFDPRISHPCFDFFPFCVASVALNARETEQRWRRGSKMSAPLTIGLSVGLLLRVIDVKQSC